MDPRIRSYLDGTTVAEMFRRVRNGLTGIVSTAFIADATPTALVAHTRDRG
jgi:alkaline phosphatase